MVKLNCVLYVFTCYVCNEKYIRYSTTQLVFILET